MLCFEAVFARRVAVLGFALSAAAQVACSSHEHPPAFGWVQSGGGGSGGRDGGAGTGSLNVGEGDSDAGLCGDQRIPAIIDPPNLYFVVDRSGSMTDPLSGSPSSKFENARVAISVMLRAVGHRVRYAAAVYPAYLNESGCAPGMQIFPITAGDSPKYAARGENGLVLQELLDRLGANPPSGGTPTAATLRQLQ